VRGIRVTHKAFERLERSAVKVARSVLRRGGYSNAVSLSDRPERFLKNNPFPPDFSIGKPCIFKALLEMIQNGSLKIWAGKSKLFIDPNSSDFLINAKD
jgi:hypothetical protein